MGFDKLMAPLNGLPVLQRTLNAFSQTDEISEIILVTNKNRYDSLDTSSDQKKIIHVEGGSSRQESVSKGINQVSEKSNLIAIHDGARPLIAPQQISESIKQAYTHSAVANARQVTETIKRASTDGYVTNSVDRENLWLMETPQIFKKELIHKAYKAVENSNSIVTDEVSAMDLIGIKTFLVDNPFPNPKITFPQDLALAEKLLGDE